MAFFGLNKYLSQEKIPVTFIKKKVILTFERVTADNLKIEIPISKITRATHNKDNRVNKLVTVFAGIQCTWIGQKLVTNPDSRQCSKQRSVIGDKNQLVFRLLPRSLRSAPGQAPVTVDRNQHAFHIVSKRSMFNQIPCLTAKTRAVLRSTTP
jgi:hypothetical protein